MKDRSLDGVLAGSKGPETGRQGQGRQEKQEGARGQLLYKSLVVGVSSCSE